MRWLPSTKVSRMKHRPILIFTLLVLLGCLPVQAALRPEVEQVLTHKWLARSQYSVHVVRLGKDAGSSTEMLALNAHDRRIPASNLKLVTTAAALDTLGSDFRFRTVLAMRGKDVVIWGDGDPTLGDTELLKGTGWTSTTVFETWAKQLSEMGITSIENVVIDDSVMDDTFVHPHWPVDQIHKRYVAGVGGLNLNANCIDFLLRVGSLGAVVDYSIDPPTRYVTVDNTCKYGKKNAVWLTRHADSRQVILGGETNASSAGPISVTVVDPPMYAGTVLSETLRKYGIQVTGQVLRDRTDREAYAAADEEGKATWQLVAIHETPIGPVLARCNKDSMNLYAEALCKRLGFEKTHTSGSWENGTAAIGEYLEKIGIAASEFSIDDGSGLSKENRISAVTLTQVLSNNFFGPNRDAWLASLSVGDTDGTLHNRFRGGNLGGRVFGKSGYVNGVSSLSGYLHARDGNWYAFSILMNNIPDGTNSVMKELQERIVQAIENNTEELASIPHN